MGPEQRLAEIVRQHLGGVLFHVTDQANLESVDQHGLLSRDEARLRGVSAALPGGSALTQELDERAMLTDYVFLGFFPSRVMPSHPEQRRRRPRTLYIDPSVLLKRGVRLALGPANHRNTDTYSVGRAFAKIDWEVFEPEFDAKAIMNAARVDRVWKYEILVPKVVERAYIVGIE